ncbi:MAG: threonylcarbamoyl-AMP synthase [Treponema sp.]|jgi:L-threonylcarbamoyladenylate synthase|nr:threonylcarbamoyl-AMP synthase [Treponema sp.]
MRLLSTSGADIALAAAGIKAGKLAAFPTETVYGLGGNAYDGKALAAIFEAKGRPRFDPLIVHIAETAALEILADLEALEGGMKEKLRLLAGRFWPGPLSLVLPKRDIVPGLASAGLSTLAVRFPSHPAARQLIRLSTGAVAAPSANLFGRLSPTRAEHVAEQLGGRIDFIIDGGPAALGVESTVLDLSAGGPAILRQGGVPQEAIEDLIGPLAAPPAPTAGPAGEAPRGGAPRSPGMLRSHYAPRTPLRFYPPGAVLPFPLPPGEAAIFWSGSGREARLERAGAAGIEERDVIFCLTEEGDPLEGAANLFALLHDLDGRGYRALHAEAAPGEGLGRAVNDRLSRAVAR